MSVVFHPKEFLAKAAPRAAIEKLVTQRLTVSRAAVSILTRSDMLSSSRLEGIALRVIRQYRQKFSDELKGGASEADALNNAMNQNRLLVNRVQNAVVREIVHDIEEEYRGEFYEWLPSDAKEPDPLHQLNYGKRRQVGRGEMPGERWGCQCGMRILVSERSFTPERLKIAA